MKIHRSINEPFIKLKATWNERWKAEDQGLITAWEVGRERSKIEPELASRAIDGQLVECIWKGGNDQPLIKKKMYGTHLYLAMWQGLRGEDLNIDTEQEPVLVCTATKMIVTYTSDSKKYADPNYVEPRFAQLNLAELMTAEQKANLHFTAIDVETANANMGSICQIGIAVFTDGCLVEEWSTLIDPEDYFDGINISIHGIKPDMVEGKPKLPEVTEILRKYLKDRVVVCHTHFDRTSVAQALKKYELEPITATWLDSSSIARRTWKEFANSGYGLVNVCKKLGYKFKPHDALEDAKAAGHVLLAALQESQIDLDAWKRRVKQPIDLTPNNGVLRNANLEGALFGEVVVFTGALEVPRKEAADLAARIGCQVNDGVTKKTTILVVGDQDVSRHGKGKSNKHIKAEKLISEGQPIHIIRETDFIAMVGL